MQALVDELIAKMTASARKDHAGDPESIEAFLPVARPPATAAQLAELEKKLKGPLPVSYREFLQICDGIKNFNGTHLLLGSKDHGRRKIQAVVDNVSEYWEDEDGEPLELGISVAVPDDVDSGIHHLWAFALEAKGDERAVIDWDHGRELRRDPSFRDFLEHAVGLKRAGKAKKVSRPAKAKKVVRAKATPAKAEPKTATDIPLPLPDAKLATRMARGDRAAFAAWGTSLRKQGHPLGAVIAADLASNAKGASPSAKKHAAKVFAEYAAAHLAPRFKALAPSFLHFTSRESGSGRVVFKYGLVSTLDSFSWAAPMRKELLKLLADAHATWIVKLTPRDITLTDLTAFARLEALRQLNFRWTNIRAVRSLAPLAGLHQLQALSVANSSVADVAPLRRLPLVQLHLGKTPVKDLQELKGHPTLQHLELGDSSVKDISALLSCPRLICVNLWDTKVPVAQVEKLVATIKKRGVKPTSNQEHLMVGYEQLVTHNTVDW
jgi:hypothetical protein